MISSLSTEFVRDLRLPGGAYVIDAFIMVARRQHPPAISISGPETEELGTRTDEVVTVAALVKRQDGELVVLFHPGVTGHERYNYNDTFIDKVEQTPEKTDEDNIFGGKKSATWDLCAGTPGRWDRLYVYVCDIKAMVEHFGSPESR